MWLRDSGGKDRDKNAKRGLSLGGVEGSRSFQSPEASFFLPDAVVLNLTGLLSLSLQSKLIPFSCYTLYILKATLDHPQANGSLVGCWRNEPLEIRPQPLALWCFGFLFLFFVFP